MPKTASRLVGYLYALKREMKEIERHHCFRLAPLQVRSAKAFE